MQVRPPSIHITTLGCSKNLVDSERLAASLHGAYALSHSTTEKEADIIILNTCGFIEKAQRESIEAIFSYLEAKKAARIQKLYVIGCLVGRNPELFKREFPEVDGFFTHAQLPELIQLLNGDLQKYLLGERLRQASLPHHAYLKISEGCNRKCSFCAIPLMRGKHLSRPLENIIQEAHKLASQGVKEISLIAQDLSFYGIDLYGKRRLADLLQALAQIPNLKWIRLHYLYPAGFPVEILPMVRDIPNVCKYLDLPLQHISDNILRRMRRGITEARTHALVEKIRTEVPNLTLRSTFIVGYPGETEADFQKLLDFLTTYKLDRVGAFLYSHQEGTHSYATEKDAVPLRVKKQRYHQLMTTQQAIALEKNLSLVGKKVEVVIDAHEREYALARTQADAPYIDNLVWIRDPHRKLLPGNFATVEITKATAYDLWGHFCGA
ncbi:MAG: 30S ribosomal protein S12 methylthiotransferase RimO [Bacteroidia bacterium]